MDEVEDKLIFDECLTETDSAAELNKGDPRQSAELEIPAPGGRESRLRQS
jgi:hypothetical protein